ncbi:MAG: type II secretion system F family protein [Actinobacteria bacterium]|nr:type II secretion system F family protein [Actinomycetota bacterium]
MAAFAPGAGNAADARFGGVDTGAYPSLRVLLVTPEPTRLAPRLTENGVRVSGLEAANLGSAKSVVLAVDRSQSMRGQAMADASRAARAFVRRKPRSDRIAVVAVGKRAVQLTGFSSATIDADAALRGVEVDQVQGTALYDAIVLSAEALGAETLASRVLILLTDGQEVSSEATLEAAIAAARKAGVTVYPIAIESPSFSPAPLKRLAKATGGRYSGARDSGALVAVYTSIAAELKRTWQLTYTTSARPGERVRLAGAGASLSATIPGTSVVVEHAEPALPDAVFGIGPLLTALLVALCIFTAGVFALRAPHGAQIRRQLAPHLGKKESKRSRGPVQERFATASAILGATEKAFGHLKVWHSLHRLIVRADVPLRTVELAYICVGAGLVPGLAFAVGGASSFLILLVMVAGGALPIGVVWWKARRRLMALDDQLPDVLTTLAASLKAGHSFRQGIQAVVDEGHPPASEEFKRVLTETSLGRPIDDALAEMAERVGSENLSFVITSVTIQRQVGGSLAGIFDMVAETVRNRQQFARKIRSLTASGKMSAYVLLGLPFFIAGALTLMNPEYMAPLYETSIGHVLIGMGLTMMFFGSLILRKIVSFRG